MVTGGSAISLDHHTVLANVSGVASLKTVKTGIKGKKCLRHKYACICAQILKIEEFGTNKVRPKNYEQGIKNVWH